MDFEWLTAGNCQRSRSSSSDKRKKWKEHYIITITFSCLHFCNFDFSLFHLSRWRQWEALDCNDVDSVHNDFQRELPYLIFFPELLDNVVRAWARYQHPDGWIQETLQIQWGCHNRTNRLNTPGGRVMADVTPAFLAQVSELNFKKKFIKSKTNTTKTPLENCKEHFWVEAWINSYFRFSETNDAFH